MNHVGVLSDEFCLLEVIDVTGEGFSGGHSVEGGGLVSTAPQFGNTDRRSENLFNQSEPSLASLRTQAPVALKGFARVIPEGQSPQEPQGFRVGTFKFGTEPSQSELDELREVAIVSEPGPIKKFLVFESVLVVEVRQRVEAE